LQGIPFYSRVCGPDCAEIQESLATKFVRFEHLKIGILNLFRISDPCFHEDKFSASDFFVSVESVKSVANFLIL